MAKAGGPWWLQKTRGVRRWWAKQRVWGKGGIIVGSLLALLLVLAGVLGDANRPAEDPEPGPTEAVSRAATPSPVESPAGTASIPVPARPDRDVPLPSDSSTATSPTEEELPLLPPPAESTEEPVPETSTAESVYYENCDAVRAAGAAPLRLGQPGYRAGLDGDGDGVACAGD